MPRTITIPAADIFDFADRFFRQGQSVRIAVTGSSMQPFLRPHLDSVELIQAGLATIEPGDIVLFRRRGGAFILHRLYRKSQDQCYFVGDAQTTIEGPIEAHQIVARTQAIWKGARRISVRNPLLVFASKAWIRTILVRRILRSVRTRFKNL